MPPVPRDAATAVLKRGADALGVNTFTPPLLINTVPRDGRAACIQCGSCVGFPCPSDAKNGTQNTMLPRALATGRCDLVTGAMVERIDTDAQRQGHRRHLPRGSRRRHHAPLRVKAKSSSSAPAPSRPPGCC